MLDRVLSVSVKKNKDFNERSDRPLSFFVPLRFESPEAHAVGFNFFES